MNESSTMGKLHAVQGVCHFLGASEFYDSSASGVTATSRLEHLHAVFRARVLNVFGAANLKGIAACDFWPTFFIDLLDVFCLSSGGKDGRESGEESEDDLDEKDTRRATGNGNSFKDANSLSDDLSFNAKNRVSVFSWKECGRNRPRNSCFSQDGSFDLHQSFLLRWNLDVLACALAR